MDHNRLRRAQDLLPSILLVVLPLCLFGPHTIYSGNEAEFTAPFWTLVRPLLAAGAGIALLLFGLGLALPSKAFRAYVVLLFALGLVLWIQGNLLIADYGVFNGEAIDFRPQAWRNPYEISLWIGLPLAAVAATRFVFPIAAFASGALVALQLASIGVAVARADTTAAVEWKGPADSMFELSSRQNVIHIVLDGFQSELFHEILEEDRPTFDRSWSGAVFFADHAGAFPSTIVSIPAMLTGTVYRNERDLQRYVRDHFDSGSLFKSLRAGGFRVDGIAGMQYDHNSATNFYRMPRPYVSYPEYVQFAGWQLADLTLFRYAPHVLRPWIYNNDDWRLQSRFGPGDTTSRRFHSVNGAAVLGDLVRRVNVKTDERVYKYIHVGIPHLPIAVDAQCAYTGTLRVTRQRYKDQARCAIKRVTELMDRLQQLGVYDDALVVISSDHGLGFTPLKFVHNRQLPPGPLSTLAARAMALLVVKAPGSHGPVRISYAPTAITDIPATVLDAVGVAHTMPGEPALKLDEHAARRRVFTMYNWENENWSQHYFEALDVMQVNGRLLDGNNWKPIGTIFSPEASPDARFRGLYDTQRSHSGFDYRWSMPDAFFEVPPDARSFEVRIRSIAPKPQTATLLLGDRELVTVTLADQAWVKLEQAVPAPANSDVRWVHLRVEPSWRPRGDGRTLGVQTRDITWTR
jgi:hypothetical protein